MELLRCPDKDPTGHGFHRLDVVLQAFDIEFTVSSRLLQELILRRGEQVDTDPSVTGTEHRLHDIIVRNEEGTSADYALRSVHHADNLLPDSSGLVDDGHP